MKPRILFLTALCMLCSQLVFATSEWVEIRSPHFTVITDGGEKRGRDLATRFEQMRFVFGQIFRRAKVQTNTPVRIIAFRTTREIRQVSPLWNGKPVELAGFFQTGEGVNFIGLDLSLEHASEEGWGTVFHEYAHMLLNANLGQMPAWFDEGFAEFFSTIKITNKEFEYGGVPRHSVQTLNGSGLMPVVQLFSIAHDSKDYNTGSRRQWFYAQSWLAVHYLWFNPEKVKKTQEYLKLIEQHVPIPEALQRAYSMEPKKLDQELFNHFRTGRAYLFKSKLPPEAQTFELSTRPIDDLDARAFVAEMSLQSRDRFEDAVKRFEEILRSRPDNAIALRGMGYASLRKNDMEKAGPYFRRAAALDSTDARVYYYSAVLLQRMGAEFKRELLPELQRLLKKAVELDPAFADAYGWLGLSYAWDHNYQEAIPATRKAMELSPRNQHYALNLAGFYAAEKNWAAAAQMYEQLRDSIDPVISSQAEQMLNTVKQMKAFEELPGRVATRQEAAETKAEPIPAASTATEPGSAREEKASPPEAGALGFFSGTLQKVDCDASGGMVFSVSTGLHVLKLEAPKPESVSLTGADKISCSWRNKTVEGYYRSKGGHSVLRALEVH